MAPDEFERSVPAAVDELSALLDAFQGWLEERGVPRVPRDDLVLALDEAFSNAVVHGYASPGGPGRSDKTACEANRIECRAAEGDGPVAERASSPDRVSQVARDSWNPV